MAVEPDRRTPMRVWVTRDEAPHGPLSMAVEKVGLTAVREPVLERRVVGDAAKALARLGPDDWLVLTSVYAVEALGADSARVPRVATVGEATARAARRRGLRVEYVGSGGAASLFEALRRTVHRGTVCYPRSSLVSPPESWPGIAFSSPVLYETVSRPFDTSVVDRIDIIAVASPSAVEAVHSVVLPRMGQVEPGAAAHVEPANDHGSRFSVGTASCPTGSESVEHGQRDASDRGPRFASIGPTTSAALRRIGIEPWVEAPKRNFDSLARAIVAKCAR